MTLATAAAGDEPADAAQQIAGAVSPAPEGMRDAATVLGYSAGELVTLRQGGGDLVCLADKPGDERFHAACYFKALEPFMARGRELRAAGKERAEVLETRGAEIASGKLQMPPGPSALYSLTGPAGSFDPATGEVEGANRTYVVYIPYATAESTGLSPQPATGAPWIMSPGKPWAHIMLVQPAETEEEPEG
ncbi:MAG: hypothetical protein GY769_13950 [bacterium]|nr:hypothetical protein [bacterium]